MCFYGHSLDFVITQNSSTFKINNSDTLQLLSFQVAHSVVSVKPAPWIHWTTLRISHLSVSSFLHFLPYPTHIQCSVTSITLANFLNSLAPLSFQHTYLAFLSESNYWPRLLSIIAEKAAGQGVVIMCSWSAYSTGHDTLPRNSINLKNIFSWSIVDFKSCVSGVQQSDSVLYIYSFSDSFPL